MMAWPSNVWLAVVVRLSVAPLAMVVVPPEFQVPPDQLKVLPLPRVLVPEKTPPVWLKVGTLNVPAVESVPLLSSKRPVPVATS